VPFFLSSVIICKGLRWRRNSTRQSSTAICRGVDFHQMKQLLADLLNRDVFDNLEVRKCTTAIANLFDIQPLESTHE
jgi:hypothetical protein